MTQAEDGLPEERCISDPPLLRLELEASNTYLTILQHMAKADGPNAADLRTHSKARGMPAAKEASPHAAFGKS